MITHLILLQFFAMSRAGATPDSDWPNVGNDKGATRFSPLKQINRSNVKDLKVAWEYHTGDANKDTTIECIPIVIDGVLYLTTAGLNVVALDASTGKEIWKYDPYREPKIPRRHYSSDVNRGVAYWTDGKNARIILGHTTGLLISLDAKTGKTDPAFGTRGVVDLRENMGRDLSKLTYGPTSAPAIYKDTIILGLACGEGPGFEAPGDVRAFDVRSGKEVWRFQTIPGPGQFGNETWENGSWKNHGAANAWGGATVDEKHGLVFVATGSAAGDFFCGGPVWGKIFSTFWVCLGGKTREQNLDLPTHHPRTPSHEPS